jgi:hypothetical protein
MQTTQNSTLYIARLQREAALVRELSAAFDQAVAEFGEQRLAHSLAEEKVEA